MAMHNHVNFEKRLAFVRALALDRLGQDNATIIPIQYDPECVFKYNNFVYRISLATPVSGDITPSQPTCVSIPDDAKELILRLTNSECEGMIAGNRVENEVAMISFASAALSSFQPPIVPSVYGWGSASAGSQGWILQELMLGTPCSESFDTMALGEKKQFLAQTAAILKALQDFKLPETVTGWGGVTFDSSGQPISAPMVSVGAGPWPSLEDSYRSRLQVALRKADANSYIKGWHSNGVRERLDRFVIEGLPDQFQALPSRDRRVIIHGDFRSDNLLWDAGSGRITALIDYDFSSISHPCYEFLRSFDPAVGQFEGWSEGQVGEPANLQHAKLYGFPSPLPESTKDGVQWEVANAWEDELIKLDLTRPAAIPGVSKVADVDMVLGAILPWRLQNEDIVKRQEEEVKWGHREVKEKDLVDLLGRLGY